MARLVAIGNSRGLRIPSSLIKLANLDECELDFEVVDDGLLIKTKKHKSRTGWLEFMQKSGLIDQGEIEFTSNKFDEKEWTWPST